MKNRAFNFSWLAVALLSACSSFTPDKPAAQPAPVGAVQPGEAVEGATTEGPEGGRPAVPGEAREEAAAGESLPLFEGLGVYQHPIVTRNPEAQKYFNQGLVLAYAFNHGQAQRSFLEAAKRDPACVMCYWGAALVLGPNINAPMPPQAEREALGYLRRAQELAEEPRANPRERDYVAALAKRYAEPAGQNRGQRDQAYATAMGELAKKYPDDPEAATLWAEAMMDQHPWDFWAKSGQPRPWTPAIQRALEQTLQRFPDHPGAHHLYVHAMEASPFPERAVASADKLNTLVPNAGHLVHMPAHIYIRVGRYQDAINANLAAIKADEQQLAQAPGLYAMMYKPHNHHFLWAAATLAGQEELATKAANDTSNYMRGHQMPDPAMEVMRQHFMMAPLMNEVRFGKWAAILQRGPVRDSDPPYEQGMLAYARAVALVKTGKPEAATAEIRRLDQVLASPALQDKQLANNRVTTLLQIARNIAVAEQAAAFGNYALAIQRLESAVKLEDGLTYAEPPDWHHPVREILGRIYLEAKLPEKAKRVYEQDLKLFPKNVWSTAGLIRAYEVLGDESRVGELREQLRQSGPHIELEQSSF